ncbi:MAG: ATP-binding protein, partial [Promethearchaeota archaeon]
LKSNFHAEVDADDCDGCGICIDKCNMEALTLINDISTVNLDKCIGCGACVTACPSEAIQLREKEEKFIPPEDWDALYTMIAEKKRELKH